MSKEKTNPELEEKEMTPEEMDQMRNNMVEFYTAQIKVLEPQAKYEELLAQIEEFRLRQAVAIVRYATVMQGPPQSKEPQIPGEEKLTPPNGPSDEARRPPEIKGPRKLKPE